MRRRLALGLTVLVVVAAVAGLLWWRGGDETRLERAVHLAPAGTERLSWTDWSAVRRQVGVDLGDSPDGEQVAAFLDDAFATDLTSTSALVGSSRTMQDELGFSPGTLDWELFAQSPEGAVDILGLPDEDAVGALADRLGRRLHRARRGGRRLAGRSRRAGPDRTGPHPRAAVRRPAGRRGASS